MNPASVPGSAYTYEQRRQAVVAFQVLGSQSQVAQICGIPDSTISDWRRQPWWNEVTGEVRKQISDEIGAELTRHLRKSLSELGDRLENGDTVVTRYGKVKIPVRCRDLAVTVAILFDKWQLILNQPTRISSSQSLGDVASKLMSIFRAAQGSAQCKIGGSSQCIGGGDGM